MDKKNFIAFLALSLAVLLLATCCFRRRRNSAKPKRRVGDAGKAARVKRASKAAANAKLVKCAAEPGRCVQPPADGQPDVVGQLAAGVPVEPLQFVSLGSLDRETGYRMLVTLTNQGAAV